MKRRGAIHPKNQLISVLAEAGGWKFSLVLAVYVAWSGVGRPSAAAVMSYLDNGQVKVGIDLSMGGSITYLSKSGNNYNIVNNYDLGRQIQQSYYSGPQPYDPYHNVHPNWTNWPWNPIQSGDAYGHRSTVLAYTNTGQSLYLKCRPMQWALNNVPGECTFESWLQLQDSVVVVSNRLVNSRTDTAQQFAGMSQELPAVYTIGKLYRLFSYTGNAPFLGGALTQLPGARPPWVYWRATESWAALVDVSNWGLGVYHPGAVEFVGGFSGTPGVGGPYDDPTGYVSPLHREILDTNIVYNYTYYLIVGSIQQIRDWVYSQPYRPACDSRFASDRRHWSYVLASDAGWPPIGRLRVSVARNDPQVWGPACTFYATNVPRLYVRAACTMANPGGRNRGQLFWETNSSGAFSEALSYKFPVVADGQYHTYELNLAATNTYRGLITRLRFDPVAAGDAGDFVDLAWISSYTNLALPAFSGAGLEPGLGLSLQVTGTVGVTYLLEVSTNLLDWNFRGACPIPASGQYQFVESNLESPHLYFYRLRSP